MFHGQIAGAPFVVSGLPPASADRHRSPADDVLSNSHVRHGPMKRPSRSMFFRQTSCKRERRPNLREIASTTRRECGPPPDRLQALSKWTPGGAPVLVEASVGP